MLHALDMTIDALVRQEVDRPGLEVSFAVPDSRFPAGLTAPTVHFFLYHVQENAGLRKGEWVVERGDDGVATRRRPPVRVDCAYLVTAWPPASDGESGEHRLLGQVLTALLRYRRLPAGLLQGELAGQEPPLRAATVRQAYQEAALALLWRSLGTGPRAALDYTVTISVDVDEPAEIGPLVTDHVISIDQRTRA